MTVSQSTPLKHIGSFCLILFLGIFRPAAIWPEIPVSTAPIAVLAAWILLLYKIRLTVGFKAFLHHHRFLLIVIALYFVLCGLSLIANLSRYPDSAAFVRWGLTFPIIQSALVACGFLFTLPQNTRGLSISRAPLAGLLVVLAAAIIPAVAFWQILDNDTAHIAYQYTVAGDIANYLHVTRGILATSTDLGAISAIIALTALLASVTLAGKQRWLVAAAALSICLANVAAGTLSGSRGFFLAIGVGLLVAIYQLLGGRLKLLLLSAPPLLLSGLVVLQFAPPHVHYKLAKLSPVFLSFANGIPPSTADFKLNAIGTALGDRASLWERAIEQTLAHPWLGISNGGYRLLNESLGETPINNVHNAFLQLGVDAGISGLAVGLLLLIALFRRAQGTARIAILATVCAGLLVDNFADHSLAWITIASFAAGMSAGRLPTIATKPHKTWWLGAASALASVALVVALVALYQNK